MLSYYYFIDFLLQYYFYVLLVEEEYLYSTVVQLQALCKLELTSPSHEFSSNKVWHCSKFFVFQYNRIL